MVLCARMRREIYAEGMKLMSNAENRKGYRLPTEAEWEYSCRAGAATAYSFGEPWELLEKYGWYLQELAQSEHSPSARLKPNDLGLFDLHGNIWEWCQESSVRGGVFFLDAWAARSGNLGGTAPPADRLVYGLRLARTLD